MIDNPSRRTFLGQSGTYQLTERIVDRALEFLEGASGEQETFQSLMDSGKKENIKACYRFLEATERALEKCLQSQKLRSSKGLMGYGASKNRQKIQQAQTVLVGIKQLKKSVKKKEGIYKFSSKLKREAKSLAEEANSLSEEANRLTEAHGTIDDAEYKRQYDEYQKRSNQHKSKCDENNLNRQGVHVAFLQMKAGLSLNREGLKSDLKSYKSFLQDKLGKGKPAQVVEQKQSPTTLKRKQR
tara:strand:+ start:72 stop:797 length:726 start_codon:yes stop_codon:yes gene_type:complete